MKYLIQALLYFSPLLLTAQTQKLPAALDWQKIVGGSKLDKAYTIIPTVDHGFLVVGLSYSNDGQVTGHHGTTDSSDAWVVKLNSAGDMEWQKSFGGSNFDEFKHAIQVGNGDFICVGTTRSIDGDVTGLHTSNGVASDLWIVRINRYGVIQWSKTYGGSDEDHGRVIRKMVDGNYMVAGDALSNDFDVTGNQGGADIWVLKINEQGNLLWQKTYGNPNHQYVTSLTVTGDNNYIISGYQKYNNYPANPVGSPVYSYYEEAAVKIDAQGNALWQQIPLFTKGNPGPSRCISGIMELPSHQLITVGNLFNASLTSNSDWRIKLLNSSDGTDISVSNSATNYDAGQIKDYTVIEVGPDAVQMLSDSTILTCISSTLKLSPYTKCNLSRISTRAPLNTSVDFLYNSSYDGNGQLNGVIALQDDEYIAAGTMNNADVWIVKVKSLNQIKGTLFIDNNANGIKDAGEPYFKNAFVESKKNGAQTRSLSGADGSFLNFVDTGTYTTTATISEKPYYTFSPTSKQSTFTTYKNKDSFSFAVTPTPGINDLKVALRSLSAMRPGFEASFRIDYSNVGTTVIANAVIKFVKPSVMSFVSASLAPSSINADTLIWNVGSLSPFDAGYINLVLRLSPPPAVNMRDVLIFSTAINPVAGEFAPADNKDTLVQLVTGSFDPNDKQENHNGTFYIEQLQAGQPLTYTIRFQNMGTDTAFNIVVRDTLSDQLDLSTLEVIGASHPYQFNLKDNKFGTWTFTDILLPDHNTNEPASHGYVSYRIKPKSNLQIGDVVYNAASIYFDFNLPVKTNTQETIIKQAPVPPPAQPVLVGMQLNYCNSLGAQKFKILNMPATGSGVTVAVKLDAAVLTPASDSSVTFSISSLTAGTHTITVTFSNATGANTTTANFTIFAAVTPDVNVSANITSVTNLSNPVILTAFNASGGGKDPLYSFSWNSSFTNLIQTESTNNTLSINPASFALGDNKVYVKMKTSETCFTAQTNIDSINIRREISTGLIDADSPGQIITIYPNPVHGPLTIDGLNTAKVYTFTIYNLKGQAVYTKRVANQSKAEIRQIKGVSSVYWLTIYDEKRNRLLGSVKLIIQ